MEKRERGRAEAEEQRLDAALLGSFDALSNTFEAAAQRRRVRRQALVAATAVLVALAAFGLWRWQRATAVDELVEQGWALFELGRFAPALVVFRQAVAARPDNIAARRGLGWALFQSGEVAAARAVFEGVLRDAPNDPGSLNGLGQSLHREKRYAEAIAVLRTLVEHYPGTHAGVSGLVEIYLELDDCTAALPYLELLRQERGETAWVEEGLARCTAPS